MWLLPLVPLTLFSGRLTDERDCRGFRGIVRFVTSSSRALDFVHFPASLTRGHAFNCCARSSIAPGHPLRIHSNSNTRLDVLGPVGKLSIVGPNASGIGATEFRPENGELGDVYATFFFTEDGLIRLEGLEPALEVEAAVEYLLRKVQA
jgi:hypothetical protein